MTPPTSPDQPAHGPTQQREQQAIAARLGQVGFVLPGTITRRMMRCGKTGCRCGDDPPQLHGPYIQWTRTVAGKTVTKLLSPGVHPVLWTSG